MLLMQKNIWIIGLVLAALVIGFIWWQAQKAGEVSAPPAAGPSGAPAPTAPAVTGPLDTTQSIQQDLEDIRVIELDTALQEIDGYINGL